MSSDSPDNAVWEHFRERLARVDRFMRPRPPYPEDWRVPSVVGGSSVRAGSAARQVPTMLVVAALLVLVIAVGAGALRLGSSGGGGTTQNVDTGLSVVIRISGGPRSDGSPEPRFVSLSVTGAGAAVSMKLVEGTATTIALAAGRYTLSASYGGTECAREALDVTEGFIADAALVCSIR
jgi:hypothetical protein